MKKLLIVTLVALIMGLASTMLPVSADSPDWDLEKGGHFFTQTGGGDNKGYSITDEGGITFWSEFKRQGGVQTLGYPVSQRFTWGGYTLQATQRAIFQWQPTSNTVAFLNVFDILHEQKLLDSLIASGQTPKLLDTSSEAGMSWDQILQKRLALLDANPAIKAQYYAVNGDPLQINGLPITAVTDLGSNVALVCQRVGFQQWKQDVPWAKKGDVTVANGGDIAKTLGFVPRSATTATTAQLLRVQGMALTPQDLPGFATLVSMSGSFEKTDKADQRTTRPSQLSVDLPGWTSGYTHWVTNVSAPLRSPMMVGTSVVAFDSAEAAHAAVAQFDQERIKNGIENLPRTQTGDESVAIDTKYTTSSGNQYPTYLFIFRKGVIWCMVEVVSIPDRVTLEMATDIAQKMAAKIN